MADPNSSATDARLGSEKRSHGWGGGRHNKEGGGGGQGRLGLLRVVRWEDVTGVWRVSSCASRSGEREDLGFRHHRCRLQAAPRLAVEILNHPCAPCRLAAEILAEPQATTAFGPSNRGHHASPTASPRHSYKVRDEWRGDGRRRDRRVEGRGEEKGWWAASGGEGVDMGRRGRCG